MWIDQHLGPRIKVICCKSKDKPKFMHNQGDILIDDFEKNINNWTYHGGVGILYTSYENTLERLNSIIDAEKK